MSSIKDFYKLITKDGIESELQPVSGTLSPKIFRATAYPRLSATACQEVFPAASEVPPEKRQYSFRRSYTIRVFEYEED